MKMQIKDGIVNISIDQNFSKLSQKKIDKLFELFGIQEGTRMDTDIIDIDKFDEMKPFIYDPEGNPVVNAGSYCDSKTLTNSLKEYYRLNKLGDSNVKGMTFDIDNKTMEGTIEFKTNVINLQFISPDEINLAVIPEGIEVNMEF